MEVTDAVRASIGVLPRSADSFQARVRWKEIAAAPDLP